MAAATRTIAELDRLLLDTYRTFLDAVDQGDLDGADHAQQLLDGLLYERLTVPLQRMGT